MPGTVLHVLSQRPGRTGSGTKLAEAIERALARDPASPTAAQLAPFTWRAVFQRVEPLWRTG